MCSLLLSLGAEGVELGAKMDDVLRTGGTLASAVYHTFLRIDKVERDSKGEKR